MGTNAFTRRLSAAIIALVTFVCASSETRANTYIVNNTGDNGAGTLRQALADANANPGLDSINFNIPGSGPFIIALVTGLPAITDAVVLDGTSEAAFNPAGCASLPCVALDGLNLSSQADGLNLQSDGNTIRGLAIGNFAGKSGINVAGSNNVVQGNYLGTDVTGTVARPNRSGVLVLGPFTNNLIGGATPAARNVVSGNNEDGIAIRNLAFGNTVQGNYIGTTPSGNLPLGNGKSGITLVFGSHNNVIGGTLNTTPWGSCSGACNLISANVGIGVFIGNELSSQQSENNVVQGNYIGTNVTGTAGFGNSEGVALNGTRFNLIGGSNSGEGNLISGNAGPAPGSNRGIIITGGGTTGTPTHDNVVQGNRIGTTANGISALRNQGEGVLIWNGAYGNTVGGTVGTTPGACTGACNIIAFNGLASTQNWGVRINDTASVTGTIGNLVSRNSIFSNVQGGIDLGTDGHNVNDLQDPDSGPDHLQNYPMITRSGPTVRGTLNSTPSRSFVIEFFSDPAATKQQAKTFHGSTTVTTDAAGDAVFDVPLSGLTLGHFLTATATDTTTNDTSELSFPFLISSPTAAHSSITGQVLASDGRPMAGVALRLTGSSQSALTVSNNSGFYSFTDLESGSFYTVTPQLTNYTFSPATRSFSLLSSTTDATFTAAPDLDFAGNAIDMAEYFVRQQYLDFLGREPDQGGFTFWSSQVLACGNQPECVRRKRVNVSAAYFFSIEFQETGGLVDGLYRLSYARRPQFAEFRSDVGLVARQVRVGDPGWELQLAANKRALVETWVQRPAFHAAYDVLTDDEYVNTLIANSSVNYGETERTTLANQLANGSLTRAGVLLRIAEDARFVQAKFNETFVLMEYFGYLRRDPDESGYRFWLNKLNQFDGDYEQAEMVRAFIESSEYRDRFSR